MNSEKAIEIEGTITSVLPGTMFRVSLNGSAGNGVSLRTVLAHISGKMRKRFIRLTIGDRVKMEMSPYDVDKARIVYRLK
jgi:translation initiation factor IF-1